MSCPERKSTLGRKMQPVLEFLRDADEGAITRPNGISQVTFKNYEEILFPRVMRDEAGRRLFPKKDIQRITQICKEHKKGNDDFRIGRP